MLSATSIRDPLVPVLRAISLTVEAFIVPKSRQQQCERERRENAGRATEHDGELRRHGVRNPSRLKVTKPWASLDYGHLYSRDPAPKAMTHYGLHDHAPQNGRNEIGEARRDQEDCPYLQFPGKAKGNDEQALGDHGQDDRPTKMTQVAEPS